MIRYILTNVDGVTTIIKAEKTFQVVAENKLEGKFIARPVISGNSLIMRSDTHIYRIEDLRWMCVLVAIDETNLISILSLPGNKQQYSVVLIASVHSEVFLS